MKDAISWFEIPVADFDRAKTFYETILAVELPIMEWTEQNAKLAMLPADMKNGGVGGCLMSAPGYAPAKEGVRIYLNGGDDLAGPLDRVEAAGGKVVLPKTAIGENGFMGFFQDTEGNVVGFHSRN
ncbi:VOC family protein [Pontibacter sp. G13]|uniref:VOC family protein n=1 Tax=Pontibacter sp. G13 TaxID=3074898 RepID=UPI002889A328|nr:VOC family protein [Pontibacter sp. G13]WNJ18360.1 VOC family protein [Pontibacter sp. G13]